MPVIFALIIALLGLAPMLATAQVAGIGQFTNPTGSGGTATPCTAGGEGAVQYNSGGLLTCTSNFAWNAASSRLGIGLAGIAPSTTLHVSGSTAVNLVSSTATGTYVVDLNRADAYRLRLTGNTTISLTNPPPAGVYTEKRLRVMQSTTSFTLAFPSNVLWSFGASPTLALSPSSINTFVLATDDGGVSYEGFWTGAFLQ